MAKIAKALRAECGGKVAISAGYFGAQQLAASMELRRRAVHEAGLAVATVEVERG